MKNGANGMWHEYVSRGWTAIMAGMKAGSSIMAIFNGV